MRSCTVVCAPLLLAIVSAGCAPRGPFPQLIADLGKADALVREGCYTCLQEALVIYEKHAASPKPPARAQQGVFDAALLIAVREKELGIPADASMERARRSAGPVQAPQALIDAAELVIGELSGLDPDQRAKLTGRPRRSLEEIDPRRLALDTVAGPSLVAAYLALAIDCEQRRDSIDVAALRTLHAGVPLMEFRLAICPRANVPEVQGLRERDPRWTDTLFWEGRRAALGSPTRPIDLPQAIALYAQGREAFPASLALTMVWSHTNVGIEEFEAGLSGFDEVLGKLPTHREALLGRVTALSYMMRHTDAIASATRMLELGTWHIGDAYYWRAWNRYNLKEYDTAWDDVEAALRGLSNTRVYMLAGLIAYARTELPTAILRFDRAYEIDSSNCDASWMSGLVSVDQQDWGVASPKFTRAMSCFVTAAAAARTDLARLQQTLDKREAPATARETRQLARLQKDIETAEERSAQSAFNAAQCLARTGNKTQALTHVDVAATHPRMRDKALQLRAAIEKLP